MKVLVTGAAGKIGSRISQALAQKHQLIFLDKTNAKHSTGGKAYTIDLAHPKRLPDIIRQEKPDVIIHLAAIMGDVCENNPKLAKKINVDATKSLAKLALQYGTKKIIFASTAAIYHQTALEPTDENSNIEPLTVYGKTKLEAENELQKILAGSGIQVSILRIFNVYGPEFKGSLVNRLINSDKENSVKLCNSTHYLRDYIYINDVVETFRLLVESQSKSDDNVLNVGSGRALSNNSLIAELSKKGIQPFYTNQNCEPSISWADITKAKELFNFNPRASIIIDR